jgi:hypothetical protein
MNHVLLSVMDRASILRVLSTLHNAVSALSSFLCQVRDAVHGPP